jgi:pimeloyl-ACP methyl ester carboxylesterase
VRVDEHTINLDESPVFYRSAGTADVPVLYLHGIPTSSDDWVEFLGRTGGIAPDLIGFGRSGKGEHLDHSVAGLSEFLDRFLDVVHADRIRLVAHDWGVAVALHFARRHPGRVERLVVCNAPPLIEGFEWPRIERLWATRVIGEGVMGATTRGILARALRRGAVKPDAWSESRISDVWEQFDQGTQRAILRLVRSARDNNLGISGAAELVGGGGGAGGVGGRAGTVTGSAGREPGAVASGPTLVLWGERDPWYPPALGDAYAARLPGATIERLEDAGHWPWLDRADVVERVAAFLEE